MAQTRAQTPQSSVPKWLARWSAIGWRLLIIAAALIVVGWIFERFRLMTRGEQIQALAKLATTIILTTGSAGGATTKLTTAGSELGAVSIPALSLAADGTPAEQNQSTPPADLSITS